MPSSRADALSDALDRLHAGPLDGFVSARKLLAADLRAAGDADGARTLLATPKPSRTAWALNRVSRTSPGALRAMFEAREAAAAAQAQGGADAVRAALKEHRARVADVLRLARDVLAAAGSEATADQVRRMGETLQAAAVEGSATRRLLEAGRLVSDVDPEDPLAGMEEMAARPRPAKTPPKDDAAKRAAEDARKEAERAEAKRREQEARARVEQLEAEAREARLEARRAENAATRAQAEAERARRAAEGLDAKLAEAREALRALRA
ncbi:MAG TPA: hypothetical protein VIF09_09870 [Polyangiaceae bacterium]|jgi:hypothetical protein